MYSVLFATLFAILPPCQFEDSANCAWDAQGQGLNFIDITGNAYYNN